MTHAESAKLVALMVAAWPDSRWTKETCGVYELALLDLDSALATAALRRLMATTKFRPAISEVIAAALTEAAGAVRSGADAWGDVVFAVRYVGSYRQPAFRDPVVARVVEQLGWLNLCLEGDIDAPIRAQFCKAYEAMAAAERAEMAMAPKSITLALPAHDKPAWAIGDLDRTKELRPASEPRLIGEAK